jgi:cytochrome c oxidase cbb3-type subunit III
MMLGAARSPGWADRMRTRVYQALLALYFLGPLVAAQLHQHNPDAAPASADNSAVARGRQLFATYCAGCHGLDASGTQRAPSLASGSRLDKLAPEQIRQIISGGVSDKGMPAFHAFGDDKLRALLAYLDSLRGRSKSENLPGDPERGRALFFGSAQCSFCHAVAGKGGFIGPELTAYAQNNSAERAKAAITDISARDFPLPAATVTTPDGKTYRGIIRNEDNFSLQLQSLDGEFYFFSKSRVKQIAREPGSLMPSNYGQTLTAAEIDDLVSYLVSVAAKERSAATKDDND